MADHRSCRAFYLTFVANDEGTYVLRMDGYRLSGMPVKWLLKNKQFVEHFDNINVLCKAYLLD